MSTIHYFQRFSQKENIVIIPKLQIPRALRPKKIKAIGEIRNVITADYDYTTKQLTIKEQLNSTSVSPDDEQAISVGYVLRRKSPKKR